MTLGEKFAKFDWLGGVLNGAVLVIFMIVVSFSGSTYAWGSGASIALWVVFGICLIAYIAQQYFAILTTKENRIFPAHFLKNRSLVLLYIATAGAAAAYEVTLYYIPLYFQFTMGDSAIKAAVRLLPMICIFILFVLIAGGSLPIVGRYNYYYMLGGAIIVIGAALMFTIDAATSPAHVYGYEVLIAAGCGLVFQNAYAVAAAKVSKKDQSNALGFINVAQIGTMAFGLSIAGCLFQNLGFQSLKKNLAAYHLPDAYVQSALAGRISPVFSSTDEDLLRIAVHSIADTIRRLFGTTIAAGAVVFIAGLLMPFEKLNLEAVAGG
jgi:Na+/melibiose symporter-like transporter